MKTAALAFEASEDGKPRGGFPIGKLASALTLTLPKFEPRLIAGSPSKLKRWKRWNPQLIMMERLQPLPPIQQGGNWV